MKRLIKMNAMSNLVKVAFGTLALTFILFSATNDNIKVTICHIPPGNPNNCHEITISLNALEAHLDHGDVIHCYQEEEYPMLLDHVNNHAEKIVKMYE